MAKDLVLDIVAKKNSRALSELADEFDKTADKTDAFGRKLNSVGTFSEFVDDQIEKTKIQVRDLGREFDRTGSKDVFAKLRGAQGNLRELRHVKRDVASAMAEVEPIIQGAVTQGIGDGASQGIHLFGQTLGSMPPEVQAAIGAGIAAAVVASAPMIGASLSGAILGGSALGAIGAGIAAQIRNPSVESSLADLGNDVLDTITRASSSFSPVIKGFVHDAEQDLALLEPGLEKMFERLAPLGGSLLDSLLTLADHALPGIEEGLEESAPLIYAIASAMPELGDAVAEFFRDLGDGAGGGAIALRTLLHWLSTTIVVSGKLLDGLSKAYEGLSLMGHLMTGDIGGAIGTVGSLAIASDNVERGLRKFGQAGSAAGGGIDEFGDAAGTATGKTRGLTKAMQELDQEFDNFFNENMSAARAADHYQKLMNDLSDALDDNSRRIKGNSDAAIHNRNAIRDVIQAAKDERDANIKNGMSVKDANEKYQDEIDKLKKLADKLGISKDAIDDLAGNYDVNIIIREKLHRAEGLANAVTQFLIGRDIFRAAGGDVQAHRAYIVGEHQPELFVPDRDGTIYPQVPPMASPSAYAGATMPGGPARLAVTLRWDGSGDPVIDSLMTGIRAQVAHLGGSVQAALGQGS